MGDGKVGILEVANLLCPHLTQALVRIKVHSNPRGDNYEAFCTPEKSKANQRGHVLLISIVGLFCLLYLFTTRTTEDQRVIDAFEKYCYTHYALIERPTQKNEHRFLRYEYKLARLCEGKGKFNYLDEEDVRSFLEPRDTPTQWRT